MMENRSIVAIGASTGGISAMKTLLASLPPDFPAAVAVVVHTGRDSAGRSLSGIFHGAGALSSLPVEDGMPLRPGHVYVAPPDRHMLVVGGRLRLRRGPRENRTRPAIDPLFRSVAVEFGGKAVGVVLTGRLNDGTAGLGAIGRCGGRTVVQDPDDATAPEMPRSALNHVAVDHCVAIGEMGALLTRLVQEPAGPELPVPEEIRRELAIAMQEIGNMDELGRLGNVSFFTCPECNGALWEIGDGSLVRYRCHVGHAFTCDHVMEAQAEESERALGCALRSHQERAELLRRAARAAAGQECAGEHVRDLEKQAFRVEQEAELLRQLLVDPASG